MRYLVTELAMLCLLAMGARTASAQLAANEVYVNVAFTVAADHNGVNTTEYRLYRNTALVATQPVSALTANIIKFTQPGLAAGTYTFIVEAKGDGGQTPSAILSVLVKVVPPPPTAPANIRIERPVP